MKRRIIGFLIICISLLLLSSLIFYNIQIENLIDELMIHSGVCFIDGECIHEKNLLPTYVGGFSFILLLILGIYLTFIDKTKIIKQQIEPRKITKENYQKIMDSLKDDEKFVLGKIIESEGTIFQSDLVEKTDFTKVKITRILDKLEGKRIIERRRRGMTNVVILKQNS